MTKQEKKNRRRITAITDWAIENEVQVGLLGTPENRHNYAPAIVGVTLIPRPAVVYDGDSFIDCLIAEGMEPDDAADWYSQNTVPTVTHMGDTAPILITGIKALEENVV